MPELSDSIKALLADKLTPATSTPEWYFFAILAASLAAFLGWKFLDGKQKKEEPYEGPDRRAVVGESITCIRHAERLGVIEANISELHEKINEQAIATQETFHQHFREMLDELRSDGQIRDKAMAMLMDVKLSSLRDFVTSQIAISSLNERPNGQVREIAKG